MQRDGAGVGDGADPLGGRVAVLVPVPDLAKITVSALSLLAHHHPQITIALALALTPLVHPKPLARGVEPAAVLAPAGALRLALPARQYVAIVALTALLARQGAIGHRVTALTGQWAGRATGSIVTVRWALVRCRKEEREANKTS
ncbi:hypothetical protein chiPu_0029801 [Chiloscyllium punctatum]|uniref:Uncharacterized protein n=1 Tax=Chiloscyllium punctatum TaxID=137246 RepID=A0A401TS78_CHIPU|nr:hypothetical protein [Chiloscyllium punctatum]